MSSYRIQTAVFLAAFSLAGNASETVRVSVTAQGGQLGSDSSNGNIASGGRYVAFETRAENVGPPDSNMLSDVYWKDRATGELRLVSMNPNTGTTGNQGSYGPSISGNGQRVAFVSEASDLVPGDTNGNADIFVADLVSDQLVRVNVSSSGAQASGFSDTPSISSEGRYVAFMSYDSNLVPSDTNGAADIFIHDLTTGSTELVTIGVGGAQLNGSSFLPSVSAGGRFVAFWSDATNAVPGDTNSVSDVFVRDRLLGTTRRVSETATGQQLAQASQTPSISADGTLVAFSTEANLFSLDANNGPDVALKDLGTGELVGLSWAFWNPTRAADLPSRLRSISSNGRYVIFSSVSSQIVLTDTNNVRDVFRYDHLTGAREIMSMADSGAASNNSSGAHGVSDAGEVLFSSAATNLVAADTNGSFDMFVRNLGPDFPTLYCSGKLNSAGCVPFLAFAGVASASSAAPFTVEGHDFLQNEAGLLIYTVHGPWGLNFHGGKLCIKTPFVRWLPIKQAQGGAGACGGILKRNFNARIQSGADPQLTAGRVVNAQWIQRDPADPAGFGDGLSNGIQFTIGP